MTQPRKTGAQAGGFLLATCIIAGVIVGGLTGQASLGFLGGLVVGAALALLLWWKDSG